MMKRFLVLMMVALCFCGSISAEIINAGIIGNSGEQGKDLVRFGEKTARGMGVVYDRFGRLWDRAGEGVLNCYALDGRMLGQYSIPKGQDNNDKLTLVGDSLVIRVRGWIYTLDINAPSGTAAEKLNIQADRISFGSYNGKVAIVAADSNVSLLDPQTGELTAVLQVPMGNCRGIELSDDGIIYFLSGGTLYKIKDGKVVADWEKSLKGERMQLFGDTWLCHGWHGTMYRYDKDIQPDPGVILGGASGSFIGHLAQNSELVNGQGVVHIRKNLYAVSGLSGVIHLLEWNPKTKRMTIIRRIGALTTVSGIGLDLKGIMWAFTGVWEWNDLPDTPIRFSINPPQPPGVSQVAMLENDYMVATGFMWDNPTMYYGPLTKEIKARRIAKGFDLRKGGVGTAVYRQDKKLRLLSIDAKGNGQAFNIGSDGSFHSNAGDVKLNTKEDTSNRTTLAMNGEILMGASDGYVIEFEAEGRDWKETGRWNSWGSKDDEYFGGEIYITSDEGLLWVSDTKRQRVLCFDLSNKKLVGSFGQIDVNGPGMEQFDSPKTIVARGKTKAVVFDSGNQRLVKLEKK